MDNHHRSLSVTVALVSAAFCLLSQISLAQAPCVLIDNDIARLQCYDDRELRRANISTVPITPISIADEAVREPESAAESVVVAPIKIEPQLVVETVVETVVAAELGADGAVELVPPVSVVERIIYVERPREPERNLLPEEIRSTLVDVIVPLNNKKIFVLENGERWQETRDYGLRFRPGSDVYLKKGLLNAYNMSSGRNTVRVVRRD